MPSDQCLKLSDQDSLLQTCLQGGSQNRNVSFHNVIWQGCQKIIFVYTIVYNDGECGRFPVFEKLGMDVGRWTRLCFKDIDQNRVRQAQIEATYAVRFVRRARTLQAAAQDVTREEFYLSGAHE